MSIKHGVRLNTLIRGESILWHDCDGCGNPWPFSKGFHPDRDWRCHVCVQALHAITVRTMVRLGEEFA